MDYKEAKKRFMLHFRYFQLEEMEDDEEELSMPARREYEALIEEFGEPDTDDLHEAMDAISAHLAGCLDPAPQWVTDELSLDPGTSWHTVYIERITNWLMDSGDQGDEASVVRLYKVYCNDLLVHPDVTPSRHGFQAWVAGMTEETYANDVLSRLPEDLVAIPS